MNLERFISTYQKDFLCYGRDVLFPPRMKTLNPRSYEMEMDDWMKLPETVKYRANDCNCKLRPSKLLDTLHEQYPPIYEALRKAPPGYLKARVDRDRFKTTHVVDYGNLKPTILPKHVRQVFKYLEPPEKPPCPGLVNPHDLCQTKYGRARKLNGITGPMKDQLAPKFQREEIIFKNERNYVAFGGSSEYKDGVSKTGENIMREAAAAAQHIKQKGKEKPNKKEKCQKYDI